MALGSWQRSSENHEICEALFSDLGHRSLALRRFLFVTNGSSGLHKALRERFGKKLVRQRCAIHKSRNVQRHLASCTEKTRIASSSPRWSDELHRRQADAAGAGSAATDQERVGGEFAPGGLRGVADAPSAQDAGAAAQDADVDQPDRAYVFLAAAQ